MSVPQHYQCLTQAARYRHADLTQILNDGQRLVGEIPPDGDRPQDGLTEGTELVRNIAHGHDYEHTDLFDDAQEPYIRL